jgi:hypothetical protein
MRIASRALGCVLLLGLCALPASAQSIVDTARPGVAAEIVTDGRTFSIADFIDYVALVANPRGPLTGLLQQLEARRADKQVGAGASARGTTTLVSKGTVPKILGLAVENGAVTQTQSGTTLTFRTSIGGAIQALANRGFVRLVTTADPALSVLRRVSVSASFDASRGNTDGAFSGDRQQLSQWTVRFEAINRRDPLGERGLERWNGAIQESLIAVSGRAAALEAAFAGDPAVSAWGAATAAAIDALPVPRAAADVARVLQQREAAFPQPAALRPDTVEALRDYETSVSSFARGRSELLDSIASGPLVSVELTNDRPLNAPRLTNVRVVGEVGGAVEVTGNAAITFFTEGVPAGASRRARDIQFSGQLDLKLGSGSDVGTFLLSFAARYQRQFDDTIAAGGLIVPDTKGTTATGQVKLTVPVNGATRVPLSVTFANRSELISERVIRANVGLTYDLDWVFARFKP